MAPSSHLRDCVLKRFPQLRGLAWLPLNGGRTNQVWRLGDVVVKAYDAAAASDLFPNDPQAEALALRTYGPAGLSPTLVDSGADWVAYRFLPGEGWRSDPARVALLLHRLHAMDAPGFRQRPSGSAAVLAQAGRILAACKGSLGPPPPDPGVPPVAQPVPLHGDVVPGNIIDGPDGLTLIDWQCPGLGDPAEDLALFLSPAMQWLYRGVVLSADERASFLAAYPDQTVTGRCLALEPLFRWRMAAHCLWKAERGAADYAQALRLELG